MKKDNDDRMSNARHARTWSGLLERALLFGLLSLIPLRAVLNETQTFALPQLFRHVDAPGGAAPATTFFIVASILLAAAGFFVLTTRPGATDDGSRRNNSDRGTKPPRPCTNPFGIRYRATGAEFGAALLLAAMALSTLRAGQKHLALIGSLDFAGLILYFVLLRQVLHRPWRIRLALCVVAATGAVVLAKCANQHFIEIPETISYFEEHRGELVATPEAGAGAPSAGFLHDYEQRMRSGAVSGYFSHPNVLASYVVLIILAALAVAAERWRRAGAASLIAPLVIAVGGGTALVLAQSKGAAAACALSVVGFLAGHAWYSPLRRRPRIVAATVWGTVLLIALGVGLALRSDPAVLGRSMLFRTFYWRGAWSMLRNQGPLGIGAENFGRYFTRYKDVACPEDVEDPHGWWVRMTVEWGALGVAGWMLILGGVTRRIVRSARSANEVYQPTNPTSRPVEDSLRRDAAHDRPAEVPRSSDPPASIILWTGGIGAIVFGVWGVPLFASWGVGAVGVLYLPALAWVVAFAAVCLGGGSRKPEDRTSLPAGGGRATLGGRAWDVPDDPLGPLGPGLIAAVVGFLLHTGIDLALFNGGAATTFFALLAVLMAATDLRGGFVETLAPARGGDSWSRGPRRLAWIAAANRRPLSLACLVGAIVVALGLGRPAATVNRNLRKGRTQSTAKRWEDYTASPGCRAYRAAVAAYSLDATAIDELLDELVRRVATPEQAAAALPLVEEFRRRDPHNLAIHHHAATLHFQQFALTGDRRELDAAIEAARRAVAGYPTSPSKRLVLADLLERRAGLTNDPADRAAAARELRAALDLDERRIYVSQPHHLSEEARETISARLARLR